MIKIGRAGGNKSNRETPDQIGRVGISGFFVAAVSIFHSALIAKRCTSHVIITFGGKLHQFPVVLIRKIFKLK